MNETQSKKLKKAVTCTFLKQKCPFAWWTYSTMPSVPDLLVKWTFHKTVKKLWQTSFFKYFERQNVCFVGEELLTQKIYVLFNRVFTWNCLVHQLKGVSIDFVFWKWK